jgi:diguanylate cyclase (GGDEF)-like protein
MTSSSTPLKVADLARRRSVFPFYRGIALPARDSSGGSHQVDIDDKEDDSVKGVRSKHAANSLVRASRTRAGQPLTGRDQWTTASLAVLFVSAAATMAFVFPWRTDVSVAQTMLLIIAYALVSRVEFEIGSGSAVPTQLLFVPMLFALPAPIVPLCVASGYVLGGVIDYAVGRIHIHRTLVLVSSSWYSIGPALVFTVAGVGDPQWNDWPLDTAALATQFIFDLCSSSAREWIAFGTPVNRLLPFLAWVYTADALLAPLGLLAVFATPNVATAYVLTLPMVALLTLLAHDRRARIDDALTFSTAYEDASLKARKDALTGVGNRLAWQEACALADARRAASEQSVSVILLDVDGLKIANDTRGHAFGDDVLQAMGELIQDNVRDNDLVTRIGGDEFAVLMFDTDEDACAQTVARITNAIREHPGFAGFYLSAGIGQASCPPARSLSDAIHEADFAMYSSKSIRAAKYSV